MVSASVHNGWSSTLRVSAVGVTAMVARSSTDRRQPLRGSPSTAAL